MVFKIMYKFQDEDKSYTCFVTHSQYINFQKLPAIKEIIILKRNQVEMKQYEEEMQRSIDEAFANSTSHIKNLSDEL